MFEVLEWIALYDKAALGLPNACGQVRPRHIIIIIIIYIYILTKPLKELTKPPIDCITN